MSGPWYAGFADSQASNGGESPDPVTASDSSWTWDIEFGPVSDSLYARASMNTISMIGGGTAWAGGGVVEYRTRNQDGSDAVHNVGAGAVDGYADYIWDNNVDSVTFGWIIEGDNFCWSRLNMEIWI